MQNVKCIRKNEEEWDAICMRGGRGRTEGGVYRGKKGGGGGRREINNR